MGVFQQLLTGLEYLLTKKGAGSQNGLEAGAFVKTRPELEIPDVQFHFINILMRDHARIKSDRHGFTTHVCQLRPESRGYIALRSDEPTDYPIIQPNYLAAEADRIALREGVKIARDVNAQAAFDAYRGAELSPGPERQTDKEIDEWIQATAETIYHPVGTCKMGTDDLSVVDGQLKVHGVEALRVVDASVMPTLVGGNTHAPTVMIAEKASDMILGRAPLPSAQVSVAEDQALS
jgi:choline dehydrogenase